jgi:hypothetical protein
MDFGLWMGFGSQIEKMLHGNEDVVKESVGMILDIEPLERGNESGAKVKIQDSNDTLKIFCKVKVDLCSYQTQRGQHLH